LALVLYMDVENDGPESPWDDFPEVVALESQAAEHVLGWLRDALLAGEAEELRDRAASSLALLLATSPELQSLLASMLEGIAGRESTEVLSQSIA
jgi:hypothetical protein